MEDQKHSWNCHPFAYHKMIGHQEDFQEEDSWEEEDSQEEEHPEEEEDTQEEAEAHQEPDPLEEDGDHHQFKYHNHNTGSW